MNLEEMFTELAFGPRAWAHAHKLGWTTDGLMKLILQHVDPLDNREHDELYFTDEYERFVGDVRLKVVDEIFHLSF